MKKTPLFWKLFPTYLALALVSVIGVSIFTFFTYKDFYYEQSWKTLTEEAVLLREIFKDDIQSPKSDELEAKCSTLAKATKSRITLVSKKGWILCDSGGNSKEEAKKDRRPEIFQALIGKVGKIRRKNPSTGIESLYLAVPVLSEGKVVGAMRTSVTTDSLQETFEEANIPIIITIIVTILFIGLLSWYFSLNISSPVNALKKFAYQIEQGEYFKKTRLKNSAPEELHLLASALNEMGTKLYQTITKISEQKKEKDAILSSMVEGLMSTNLLGRITVVNDALIEFFDLPNRDEIKGKPVAEVFREHLLERIVVDVLENEKNISDEITLKDGRIMQVHGSIIHAADGKKEGALLVLNDITHVRMLEQHRKEFVANVSHELRTPLTAIQGYAETLIEMDDDNPELMKKFVGIIHRQTSRLKNLIEDLLHLSRLEKDKDEAKLEFNPIELDGLIQVAIESCQRKANDKNIVINSHSLPLQIKANSALLEQALINLVDNAIKYSPEGTSVDITCEKAKGMVGILVKDHGPGIGAEHHDRLFERFYSIDKARSREMGGSGLGLSIVKHISLMHGGHVELDSELGQGSTFSIWLPQNV